MIGPCVTVLPLQTAMVTVREAEVELPVPPLVEVTFPVEWLMVPATLTFTLTLTVHEDPGPRIPFDKATEVEVLLTVPLHWEAVGVLASVMPLGKLSENAIPFSVTEPLGLLIVKDKVLGESINTMLGV